MSQDWKVTLRRQLIECVQLWGWVGLQTFLDELTEEVREAIVPLLRPRLNKYMDRMDPWKNPKQMLLLTPLFNGVKEIFYGGAAGGGKSETLLGGGLQYVDRPGYAALLLRLTYKDLALPDALMDRADQWLRGTDAKWDPTDYAWRFPSGASVGFGYMAVEADKEKYQGAAVQYLAFDELSQFPEGRYRYMFSRARRKRGQTVPIRVRSGSNPGGRGHEWVKRRFITPYKEGALPDSREVMLAKLADNPFLDQEEYVEALEELLTHERDQLLHGDWDAKPAGLMFDRGHLSYCDASDVPATDMMIVRYWDLAATLPNAKNPDPDQTCGFKLGRSLKTGAWYLMHSVVTRDAPGKVENLIIKTADQDGIGIRIRMEREGGASGVNTIWSYRLQLAGYDFDEHSPSGSKIERARPVAAGWENQEVYLVRGAWNDRFLDAAEAFPQPGKKKDEVDAMSGAWAVIAFATLGKIRRPRKVKSAINVPREVVEAATRGSRVYDRSEKGVYRPRSVR